MGKSNKKLTTFSVVILIFIVGTGAFYFSVNKKPKNISPVLTNQVSPSPTTQPNTREFNPNELNGFPIYPDTTFIKKQIQPPCTKDQDSGFSACGSVTYLWNSKDDYDQISSWYREDRSNSGWKCSGGAGSYEGPRSAYGKTTCRKDILVYNLSFSADPANTEVILQVPYK